MGGSPDFYAVLGLGPAATAAEIDRAYRLLLRRHHPDTRPGSATPAQASHERGLLAQITDAHTILADPVRRARYDHSTTQNMPREQPEAGQEASAYGPINPCPTIGARVGWPAPPSGQPSLIVGPLRWEPAQHKPRQDHP